MADRRTNSGIFQTLRQFALKNDGAVFSDLFSTFVGLPSPLPKPIPLLKDNHPFPAVHQQDQVFNLLTRLQGYLQRQAW